MSDLVERLKKTADAVDLLDSGSRYTLSMRNATKAILTEAADALSLIEAERDEAIAETWRQIEGANRQFAVQNSIVHQITDERDKLREALKPFARVAENIPTSKQDKDVARVVMDEILTAQEMEDFAKRGAPVRSTHVELILSLDGLRAKHFRAARAALHPTDNDHGVGR